MKKCPKCGVNLAGDAVFCSKCGAKIEVQAPPQPQAPAQSTPPPPAPVQPVPPPPPPAPLPRKGMSTGAKVAIWIIVIFLVLVVGGGVAGCFLIKRAAQKVAEEFEGVGKEWTEEITKEMKEGVEEIVPELEEKTKELAKEKTEEEKPAEKPAEKPVEKKEEAKKPAMTPSEIAKLYMTFTLGTIPGSSVDYDLARQYLTPELQVRFDEPGFVPLSYGIQQGPSDVRIESEKISGSTATVRVSAQYGTSFEDMWDFELVIQDNEWKIKEITCLVF